MIRMTCFLALATAWCADAVLMFTLAEARWGSVLNRIFAVMLLGSALLALIIAIAPPAWCALERLAVRLYANWSLAHATLVTRRNVTPSHLADLATPTP